MKRQENIKMVGAFRVVTRDEISGLEQLFPERNAVFGRIDNFHILAVSVGVELDVGIVDRQAEVGLQKNVERIAFVVVVLDEETI